MKAFRRAALSLTLSRITGRENLIVLLLLTAAAHGQTLTFPTGGQFHPGASMPVTIEAPGPGLIAIRGEGMQGIDWPAAGRGSVTVPLTIWRNVAGDLTLTVNGKPQVVTLTPLVPGDVLPQAPADEKESAALQRIAARWADDDALAVWFPGRPLAQRRWLMLAALAGTLAVGAVVMWRGKQGAIAALAISAAVCGGIVFFAPAPPVRRELPIRGEPGYSEIDLAATRSVTVDEPLGDGLWLIPSTLGDIASLDPALECSATGQPMTIRIHLPEQGRARFIRHASGRFSR